MAEDLYREVAGQVSDLVARCVEKIAQANSGGPDREGDAQGRLFFPDGIELIYVTFKVAGVELTLAFAAPNAKYPAGTAMEASMLGGDSRRTQDV